MTCVSVSCMAIGGDACCERRVEEAGVGCNLGRKLGRAGLEVSLGGEKEVGRPKGNGIKKKKKRKGNKREEEMGWADLGLGPTVLVFLF